MNNAKGLNYEQLKNEAIAMEPFQEKISLSQVEIDNNGQLTLKGTPVRVADGVVETQLLGQILKISPQFSRRVEKLTSTEMRKNLVNLLKTGLSMTAKDASITIVGSPRNQTITNILPGKKDFISNTFALKIFEDTMNAKGNEDLTLVGFNHLPAGGIELNVRKGINVTPKMKSGMIVGEEFNPGYTFINNPLSGISLAEYIERLACTNGMTIRNRKGEFRLDVLAEGKIRKFFEEFVMLGKNNFIPGNFPDMLHKAMTTSASFMEVLEAKNIMQGASELKTNEVSTYLPEFNSVVNKLARKGVDYVKATDVQLRNLPTEYKVWDVVNRVTWFGSHDTGNNASMNEIQRKAGDMFKKPVYDTENVLVF